MYIRDLYTYTCTYGIYILTNVHTGFIYLHMYIRDLYTYTCTYGTNPRTMDLYYTNRIIGLEAKNTPKENAVYV